MALGAEHVQATEVDDLLVFVLDLLLDLLEGLGPELLVLLRRVFRRVAFFLELGVGEELDVAAKHDVGTTTGHVGGHGHGALAARHGHDGRFLLVLLRVEHLVLDAHHVEQRRDDFRRFDGRGAQQHRLALGVALGHVLDDRRELLLLGAEDEVVLVLADHRAVRRDRQHAELVGAHELGGLGLGRTGHARELVVHTEIVLQRDRGKGLVLGLDLHMLLGLNRLMQAFVVAAARQDAAGVLIDDEHLAVRHHIVAVAQEQFLGLDRVVEVADKGRVVRLVQVVDAQVVLDLRDARVEDADGLLLLVDLVVLVTRELEHELGELAVPTRHVAFGGARDDKRRTRLVDEDRVDLVDDGVVVAALHELVLLPCHVVAQVVEAELVVRAVCDVRVVLLAALRRLLPGDDAPDAHAEEAVDAPHELALVARQIVINGDDVHALALKRIEIARQRGHKGLAFTGLHFGDVAPMQRRTAHELHVEVALSERTLRDFAHRGEGFGHDVVERSAIVELLLELGGLALELFVAQRRDLVLKGVDLFGNVLKSLHLAAFTHTKGFIYDVYQFHSLGVFGLMPDITNNNPESEIVPILPASLRNYDGVDT